MSPLPPDKSLHRRDPEWERALNAWFDGETPDDARPAFVASLATDAEAAREFAETEALIESLRHGPGPAPDCSASVLAEVGRRTGGRAWLEAPERRRIRLGRLAAAAALLLALGGGLMMRRAAPERFSDRPAPLSAILTDGRAGATDAATSIAGVFESARSAALRVRALVDAADAPAPPRASAPDQRYIVGVPVAQGDDLAWASALASRNGAEFRSARFLRPMTPPRD